MATRTIHVSNLPQEEGSNDEIRTFFAAVGPVTQARIVIDHSTGKRKGFGFVEYVDAETALSAVRNLQDSAFYGRQLRVSLAEQDTRPSGGGNIGTKRKCSGHLSTGPDLVAQLVDGTAVMQLRVLLDETCRFASGHPGQARTLLHGRPQLHWAVLLAVHRLHGLAASAPPLPRHPVHASSLGQSTTLLTSPPHPRILPMPLPHGAAQGGVANTGLQRDQLLRQLAMVTPEQLAALPPAQKKQMELLRYEACNDGAV